MITILEETLKEPRERSWMELVRNSEGISKELREIWKELEESSKELDLGNEEGTIGRYFKKPMSNWKKISWKLAIKFFPSFSLNSFLLFVLVSSQFHPTFVPALYF